MKSPAKSSAPLTIIQVLRHVANHGWWFSAVLSDGRQFVLRGSATRPYNFVTIWLRQPAPADGNIATGSMLVPDSDRLDAIMKNPVQFVNFHSTKPAPISPHGTVFTITEATENQTTMAKSATKTRKSTEADFTDASLATEKPAKAAKSKASKPAKTEKPAKAPKVKPAKSKKDRPIRVNTGFVAAIRKCFESGKYTVSDMAAEIMEQFDGKTLLSIKRIGHNVAKQARKADPDTKHHWLPGAPASTGYMARIDELLREGQLTTRQIGEKVAVEFPKDEITPEDRLLSAKKVVRARLKRLTKNGEKLKVPHEADIREEKPVKEKAPKVAKAPKAAKSPEKKSAKPAKRAKKK